MTYKQQEKAFNKLLNGLDANWANVNNSNINGATDIIDILVKYFVIEVQSLFPLSSIININNVINQFNHILEVKFDEFYYLLNSKVALS